MIVGIDLGTTNSLVAVWRDGQAELIPNALGEYLTPSCVSVAEDGAILVGRSALERAQTHPNHSARTFKRYMGTNKALTLGALTLRPEELSSFVLRSLKRDAEAALGAKVEEAIITVPAYFSDAQRKATRAAGELAGLRVERLLNEPTAASLAYGIHQKGAETKFLVFDLGGGTFDVSILEMFEGVMEVRATAGDNFLGGEDFVEAIVQWFFSECAIPSELRHDEHFLPQLKAQAEKAKCALSHVATAPIVVRHGTEEYAATLTEGALATICRPLLQRLRTPVERAMRDANLRGYDLDNVVLAGGATRMPLIRRLVTSLFGRFPAIDFNPDEVVARGAAVQAGLKARDQALDDMVMTDVAPYSLGVGISKQLALNVVSDGHFDPVIERNTAIPTSRVKRYQPAAPSQPLMELGIYQGEARLAADNILLGNLRIKLPAALDPASCPVDVRFTYDVSGILEVDASVISTGERFSVVIEGNPGVMTNEEITARLRELAALKIHPRDETANRTLLARSERMYQQLRGELREWLAHQILAFESAMATQDKQAVAAAFERLSRQLDTIETDTDPFNPPVAPR